MTGKVIKGIGGFYYVKSPDGEIYECKARGVLRKEKVSPLAGDNVEFSVNENAQNTIDEILPRKNCLVRPPVANVDNLFIISSVDDPKPNLSVIDKMIAIACHNDINPIIVFNKTDICSAKKYEDIYTHAGFDCFSVCAESGEGIENFKKFFKDRLNVLTGNSGVGKSSILNRLDPSLNLTTGSTSKKLGRGRHTTKCVELFDVCGGTVADTAGFSSLELEKAQIIKKEELPYCFPEFSEYLGECKFVSCTHTKEKGCAVLEAVENGDIEKTRFESYLGIYEQVKNIKDWELR